MTNDTMSIHRHHFEKAFKDFCTNIMKKYNLTNNEVIILIFLSENTKNTAKDIVDEFLFSKSHVSLSTDQLTRKGYIKKIPDGKATRLLVTPKGQEVVYESSWYKFGKMALEQAGTDELLRNDIINSYIDMGINLEDKK